jgi:hypothetical protein
MSAMSAQVPIPDLLLLREALEASWDAKTSYASAIQEGNPAFGQCYPSSWVVNFFYPELVIVKGRVWTGASLEDHFWNVRTVDTTIYHIDFTWQQFPSHSVVRDFRELTGDELHDSASTVTRCALLKRRVLRYIQGRQAQA